MFRHLSTSCLPLATLLLAAASCTRTADPAPLATTGTASYTLTAQPQTGAATTRVVTCQAKATPSSSGGFDYLLVTLTTVPQPKNLPETLKLYYYKQSGNANNLYQPGTATLDNEDLPNTLVKLYGETITPAMTNHYSSKFEALFTVDGGTPDQVTYTISNGVFTDAQ